MTILHIWLIGIPLSYAAIRLLSGRSVDWGDVWTRFGCSLFWPLTAIVLLAAFTADKINSMKVNIPKWL